MYILIELVPEACGTGFGVFCCVVLGLALLFIMAQYAMTGCLRLWLLSDPAAKETLLVDSPGSTCRRRDCELALRDE